MSLIVVDISSNNPDYKPIIDGADAVIIKISEGLNYINPLANEQYAYAKSKNKLIGLYHFVVGSTTSVEQANFFYNSAQNYINDDPTLLVFDWERPQGYPALTGDEPKAFGDRLYTLSSKRAIIYMSHSDFISDSYDWSDITPDYSLWIAGYPLNDGTGYTDELQKWADDNYFSNPKYAKATIAMWQFTSVPHDLSVFYGDANAWYAYANLSHPVTPKPKFNKDARVKLSPQATHSAYGTAIDNGTKQTFGVIDYSFPMEKSNSKFAYRVAMHYQNTIIFWHFLEQDLVLDN